MAARWEMQAMNMYFDTAPTVSSAAGATSIFPYGLPSADTLRIEDLLDFTSLDLLPSSSNANVNADAHHPPPPPAPAAVHNSIAFTDDHFIPCEEAAELEWLSQFVEDSFSSNPYPPIPTVRQAAAAARSKCPGSDYHSHQSYLMHAAPTSSSTSSSSSDIPSRASGASSRRKRGGEEGDGGARRCTHCASERTPQWRTGPMGPKTLCNACGVRYKSGRLVPEYRPASSPTFVLTQHSNSHRKVMELSRQKEHVVLRHHDGGGAAAEMMYNDYEVC